MITLPGSLSIKKINGTRGAFCVGELHTEIGEFRVKSTILDQFEEGRYTGQFALTRIYPNAYTYFGKMVVEIRAEISDLQLDDEGDQAPKTESAPSEPDPLDEVAAPAAAPQPAVPQAEAPAPAQDEAGPERAPIEAEPGSWSVVGDDDVPPAETDPDRELFGAELHAAVASGGPVKLDPSVDRAKFRLQRDRLKALGYRFDAAGQAWLKPE